MPEKLKPVRVVVDITEKTRTGKTDVFLVGDYPIPVLDYDLLKATGFDPSTLKPGDELEIQITVHRLLQGEAR